MNGGDMHTRKSITIIKDIKAIASMKQKVIK